MMSDDFGPLESGNNTGAKVEDDPLAVFDSPPDVGGGNNTGATLEDNPLSVFDAPPYGGGGTHHTGATMEESPPDVFASTPYGGGGTHPPDVFDVTPEGGTADLLWNGSLLGGDMPPPSPPPPPPAADGALFEPVDGEMKEYALSGDSDEDGDGEFAAGGAAEPPVMRGWNRRLDDPDGADVNAEAADVYGTDDHTASMDVNRAGGKNNSNSRRGIFGGWGSRRGTDSAPASAFSDGNAEATLAYGEGGITGDLDASAAPDEVADEQETDNRLRPGDHIYIWQTYGLNPRAYQRHAVVCSVTRVGAADPLTLPAAERPGGEEEPLSFDLGTLHTEEEDRHVEVTVVSFYHLRRVHGEVEAAASGGASQKRAGSRRDFLIDFIGPDGLNKKKPIRKVKYGRKVKKGLLSQKAGVGTALKKDQVGLIMARVQYLLDHPEHMPAHNALSANGECASLWTVTGRWCTLQGASILAITGVGQAGGALLAGGVLSNLTLLVPMPGVWGVAGWWWYVPATVAYPFLVPMLVAMGMASLVPLEILRRNRKKWRVITDGLSHRFWSAASEGIKEEYFGLMASAEREAATKSFFGVREAAGPADDAKYMPVGEAPGGIEDDEDEALAMQQMENSCQKMAGDMKVDLSGRPPSENDSPRQGSGMWGKVTGSFRRKGNGSGRKDDFAETQQFRSTSDFHD